MFTLDDMRNVAREAYGQLGVTIVDQWDVFNRVYYGGALRPIPIFITQSQPFGKRIAYCTGSSDGARHIALNLPTNHAKLVADNSTLLHERLHQYLHERGEESKHTGEPWRREIMRITRLITGKEIWAGASSVRRINGKPTRYHKPHPETGAESLKQSAIARWPHDGLGIDMGPLGKPSSPSCMFHWGATAAVGPLVVAEAPATDIMIAK
jgi:hypothetical protein